MFPFRFLELFATQARSNRPKSTSTVRQLCSAVRCSTQPFEFLGSPLQPQGHLRARSQHPHHIPLGSYIMSHLHQEWAFHHRVCNIRR